MGAAPRNIGKGTKVLFLVLGVLVSAYVVPSAIQPLLPTLAHEQTASLQESLSPAAPYQQTVPVETGSQTPPTISLSDALGIAYAGSQSQPLDYNPVITLASGSIIAGKNISFVVQAWPGVKASELTSLALQVFVVDPEGVVMATYPSTETLYLSTYSNGEYNYYFSGGANGFTPISNSFSSTGILFTINSTDNELSAGTWRIYALVEGITPQSSNPTSNISGSAEQNVTVNPPVGIGFLPALVGVFSAGYTLYRVENYALVRARNLGEPRVQWLKSNATLVFAVIILAAYFYFLYYQ